MKGEATHTRFCTQFNSILWRTPIFLNIRGSEIYIICAIFMLKNPNFSGKNPVYKICPRKQTAGANAQEKQLQVKQSWGLRRVYAVGRPQWPINWLCLPRVGRLPWLRASPADKVRPSAGGLGPSLPRFPIYTHSHRSPGFKRKYWNIKETKKHR